MDPFPKLIPMLFQDHQQQALGKSISAVIPYTPLELVNHNLNVRKQIIKVNQLYTQSFLKTKEIEFKNTKY